MARLTRKSGSNLGQTSKKVAENSASASSACWWPGIEAKASLKKKSKQKGG